MIVIVALLLFVLLGFIAFVVDVGYLHLIKNQATMAADAASLAASIQLDSTDEGLVAAIEAAITTGSLNTVAGEPLALTAGDIEFGVWDGTSFTASTVASEINASRVNVAIPNTNTFFAKVAWNTENPTVHSFSTTKHELGDAGSVDCYLPLAIPSCLLEDLSSASTVDLTLSTGSGLNAVGWARVGGTPSQAWTRAQMRNCEADGEVVIDDDVVLSTNAFPNTHRAIRSEIVSGTTSWDSDTFGTIPTRDGSSLVPSTSYGQTLEAPILVFEDDSYCTGSGSSFSGTEVVSGFVWGVVYDVTLTSFRMRVNTQDRFVYGTSSGGPAYGVVYDGPVTFVESP